MDSGLWLATLGVALWLGLMVLALLVSIRPAVLRITQALVCPPGVEMVVNKLVYSYHQPGQGALDVYYLDQNRQRHDIKMRALLAFWLVCTIPALPIAYLAVQVFIQLPK